MIVGADCSTSTEPVAELAPFWNLVQVNKCMHVHACSVKCALRCSVCVGYSRAMVTWPDKKNGIVVTTLEW